MLQNIVATIHQWISIDVLIGLTIVSIIGFIASLVAIPWILIRLPSDYFDLRVPRHWMKDHHPVLRMIGLIIKNVVGFVFLLAGFLMLFLPGQGLLTMLIGISFLDFPNKRNLEARIIGQPLLLNAINTIRHKFNKLPLTLSTNSNKKPLL
ncbi:PGPGW domain-containing protein [Nitrosomonas sp.]|uniref:PGPGW domain-containing protein n=1 Tax=Nitrosomonas sp. TaxID=42353 RepID=UPI0025DC6142|nr:PGPGW domain-containing protein [Nitrosomonas sp.]